MEKIHFEEIPHFVQIETSYNCNARCKFCYNPRRNLPPDYTKLKEIVKEVSRAKIPHVQLTGGEISLLPLNLLNEIINELSLNSSVSIQTNGMIYLEGLSKNLAAIYVSLHGTKRYHELLTQVQGSWGKITTNIKEYIQDGFEVNCDFTLTSINYSNFEKTVLLAGKWGIHQYSINKFEPAGLGLKNFAKLAPSSQQFKKLVDQIIRVQKQTKIEIGFCTAIPFCLDLRLAEHGLSANCGAGVSFLSVSPIGEARICNQSDISYGNILKQDLIKIWRSRRINDFRNLSWVTEPCKDCFLFKLCQGGCKVDNSLSKSYCVDYSVRDLEKCPISEKEWEEKDQRFKQKFKKSFSQTKIQKNDVFYPSKFTKLNLNYKEKLLITRYQTIKLSKESLALVKYILKGKKSLTDMLRFGETRRYEKKEIYNFLRTLLFTKAIHNGQKGS